MPSKDNTGPSPENVSDRFDRVPASSADRAVPGRASRAEILDFFADRFGIQPAVFDDHTFWERGSGKIWLVADDLDSPADIEALGLMALRTRQEHWKPTLEAVQRVGGHATRNCIDLSDQEAARFFAGETQDLAWDGDWGYLIVRHEIAGSPEPLGVGLYVHGELQSMVPKGRRQSL